MVGLEPSVLMIGFVIIGVIALGVWFGLNFYQKCPPNQAMIISGFGAQDGAIPYMIVVGGGRPVLPMLQQRSYLSLEVFTVEVPATAPVVSLDGAAIFISGVTQIKVRGDKVSIASAAESFLSKSDEEVRSVVYNIVRDQMIATIQKGTASVIRETHTAFIEDITTGLQEQLAKVGLCIVSSSFEFDFQKSFQTDAIPV